MGKKRSWVPFGRKNWIEKVKVEELEKEIVVLDNQIQLLSKEIARLEEKKKKLFRQGIGKSDVEKLLLAEKIKDIDAEIKMKMKEYNRLIKMRRAMSNILRLKRWEKKLKERGIWEKIKDMEPDKLIEIFSSVNIEDEMIEKNVDKINEILGASLMEVEVDSSTKEILELWEKVESAELTPEAVEEELSVKVEAKEASEEEKELL